MDQTTETLNKAGNYAKNTEDGAVLFAAGSAVNAAHAHPHDANASVFIIPEGYKTEAVRKPEHPTQQTGNAQFTSVASFCFYTNLHKRPNTLIYANTQSQNPSFVAVYDDHHAYDAGIIVDEGHSNGLFAEHKQFRATLTLNWSEEWKTWNASNKTPMSQLEFASFIEDNIDDVIEPSGADMLTTILDFKTSSEGRFNTKANLHNGSVEFVYTDTVSQASGTLTMPTQITINIPVIKHNAPQEILARLKYRVKDGKLAIWYEIIRAHRIEDVAIDTAAKDINEQTSVPVLYGTAG